MSACTMRHVMSNCDCPTDVATSLVYMSTSKRNSGNAVSHVTSKLRRNDAHRCEAVYIRVIYLMPGTVPLHESPHVMHACARAIDGP